jgi:hypothetical protein
MSVCTNVTVKQDSTIFFSNVVATLSNDGTNILITLGKSGKEVNAPQVGQKYLIQGDPSCVDTFGVFQQSTSQGWQFQNVLSLRDAK